MKDILNFKVNIVKQPVKSSCSVIVVTDSRLAVSFPIAKESHDGICKINEACDIFFIFISDRSRNVAKNKFTTLYGGSGWLEVGTEKELCLGLTNAMSYLTNVSGYLAITVSYLPNLTSAVVSKLVDNIRKLTTSDTVLPYLKIQRQGPDDLADIYLIDEEEKSTNLTSRIVDSYKAMLGIVPATSQDNIMSFARYTSYSEFIYIKAGMISVLLQYLTQSDSGKAWLRTFQTGDIRSFLSSVVMELGILTVDVNIEDLDINSIK